jgi:hypothetical protein
MPNNQSKSETLRNSAKYVTVGTHPNPKQELNSSPTVGTLRQLPPLAADSPTLCNHKLSQSPLTWTKLCKQMQNLALEFKVYC